MNRRTLLGTLLGAPLYLSNEPLPSLPKTSTTNFSFPKKVLVKTDIGNIILPILRNEILVEPLRLISYCRPLENCVRDFTPQYAMLLTDDNGILSENGVKLTGYRVRVGDTFNLTINFEARW